LIPGGNVYVGHSPDNQRNSGPVAATFEGWVDDFKIFLQPVNQINPEVACNHANGTIAGVRNNNGRWPAIANAYPNSSHSRVRAFVNRARVPTDSRYVCYADYRGDNLAHAHNIPGNLRSVREAITFPEGPLVFNQPRPNSSSNQFCLSCHKSDSLAGLGLGALGRRPNVNAMNDPRRQPSQPEPVVRGVIPANWLGPNLPAARILTGPNGAQIDRWLLRD